MKKLKISTSNPSWSGLDKLIAINANAAVEVRFITLPNPFSPFPSSLLSSQYEYKEVSVTTRNPTCAFNKKLLRISHLHGFTNNINMDIMELTTL
ncbi:unnamed protein product [Lupinus luteus]|uniref:Uncharacterized protein n=1 Tax=Lupinus luteus TaxID=3873 RepID=A0AAV1WZF8_LUPLU